MFLEQRCRVGAESFQKYSRSARVELSVHAKGSRMELSVHAWKGAGFDSIPRALNRLRGHAAATVNAGAAMRLSAWDAYQKSRLVCNSRPPSSPSGTHLKVGGHVVDLALEADPCVARSAMRLQL